MCRMARTGTGRAAGAWRARQGRVLQDEAAEGELGRVGQQVVTQAGPFLFGDVLGRKHTEGGLLVVEVVEQDWPVIGEGRREGVVLVGSGGGRPRRDCGVRPGQRGLDALVLGLHAQDDVRLQFDPEQERQPR